MLKDNAQPILINGNLCELIPKKNGHHPKKAGIMASWEGEAP
jgi:hypothetical protein